MSGFGIRPSVPSSIQPTATPPVAPPTEVAPQAEQQAVQPPTAAAPVTAPVARSEAPLSPGEEVTQDAQAAIADYNPAKKSPFKLSYTLGAKFSLMDDFGGKTNMSKVGLTGGMNFMDLKLPKTGNSTFGVSSELSSGLSVKNYDYKGKNNTNVVADLGLEVKQYMKTELGHNYLKFGPTLGAGASYDITKNKLSTDMTAGFQVTFQTGRFDIGISRSQSLIEPGPGVNSIKAAIRF